MARGSIAAVVHVAKLMLDDPVLVSTVSAAVYNFVSRQGAILTDIPRCILVSCLLSLVSFFGRKSDDWVLEFVGLISLSYLLAVRYLVPGINEESAYINQHS